MTRTGLTCARLGIPGYELAVEALVVAVLSRAAGLDEHCRHPGQGSRATTTASRHSRTERALRLWLDTAAPGEAIVYHRGFLARQVSALSYLLPEPERRALLGVASRARAPAEAGLADLVQRRHGEEDYAHLLVVRRRPRRMQRSTRPLRLTVVA